MKGSEGLGATSLWVTASINDSRLIIFILLKFMEIK